MPLWLLFLLLGSVFVGSGLVVIIVIIIVVVVIVNADCNIRSLCWRQSCVSRLLYRGLALRHTDCSTPGGLG